MANIKISELPQLNFSSITNNDVIPIVDVNSNTTSKVLISDLKTLFTLSFTGGTVSGDTIFQNGLTANTISATTYQNLPIDPNTYITGFSYNDNTFTIGDNLGNTFNTTINDVTGLTINGTLSATTISGGTLYGDGSNLTNLPQPSQIEYPVGYWTNFTRNAVSNINSAVIVKNFIYAGIHIISSDVSIDRVRCRISTPSGGSMVIGIYKYNYLSDIFDLILQVPGNINLAVGGTAQELTFVTPLTLTSGVYALATNSQNDASIDVISLQQYEPIFGFNSAMGSANWLCSLIKSETYTGTLPSTIATSFLSNVNVAPHLLFNVV